MLVHFPVALLPLALAVALLVFEYGIGTATQQVSDSSEEGEHSLEEHEH